MPSLTGLLLKWPVIRQIRERADGTGIEAMSDKTRAMHARIDDAQVARSVCPYCGVGCGQLIYHKDGKLVSIEGDPESPISQGNLCPEGRRIVSVAHPFATRNENEISRAARERMDGNFAGSRDGPGRRPRLGIAQTHVCAQARRQHDQSHNGDLSSRRRHARQRRKLSHQETFHSRPGDGVHIQPGPDMT